MEIPLFVTSCTTCQAQLSVRSAEVIGHILACPKCGSMVQILPPPGWVPPSASPEPTGTAAGGSQRAASTDSAPAPPSAALPPPLPQGPLEPSAAAAEEIDLRAELVQAARSSRRRQLTKYGAVPLVLATAALGGWRWMARGDGENLQPALKQSTAQLSSSQQPAQTANLVTHGADLPSDRPATSDLPSATTGQVDPPAVDPAAPRSTPENPPEPTVPSPASKVLPAATATTAPSVAGASPHAGQSGVATTSAISPPTAAQGPVDLPAPGGEVPATQADPLARLAIVIPAIDLDQVRLVDAVRLVGRLSSLPVDFDLEALGRWGVGLSEPVTVHLTSVSLDQLLAAIVESRGLVYHTDSGRLTITHRDAGPKRLQDGPLQKVSYTVSDLTQSGGGEALAALVKRFVAPATWDSAGGQGTIDVAPAALAVSQTSDVHRELLSFCEKLRTARGLPLRSRLDARLFSLETSFQAARPKLSQPLEVNFFTPTPLEEIVATLEELTATTIVLDAAALASDGKSGQSLTTLQVSREPLGGALSRLAGSLGLVFWVADGSTFQITTPRAAVERMELDFYPLAQLLPAGASADAVLNGVRTQVAENWQGASATDWLYFDPPSRALMVRQSQDVQVAVQAALLKLFAASSKPAQ